MQQLQPKAKQESVKTGWKEEKTTGYIVLNTSGLEIGDQIIQHKLDCIIFLKKILINYIALYLLSFWSVFYWKFINYLNFALHRRVYQVLHT